jgi:hypothetical protein
MNVVPTELNRRLAEVIRHAVAAETFYVLGRSGFWRLVGLGLLLFGLGAGTGLAFYGYANITRNSVHSHDAALAISKALSDLKLNAIAEGTVQIEPRELTLAKDQTVSLGSANLVHLDPAARVRADGEIVVQGPSISPLPSTGSRKVSVPEILNFTVFKSVPFEKGRIVTGWTFLTSAQRSPTDQYCYYSESSEETPGRNIALDIATNGRIEAPKELRRNFDLAAAAVNCVWFRSDGQ